MEGFLVANYKNSWNEALRELKELHESGQLTVLEDLRDGLASAPTAFLPYRHRSGRAAGGRFDRFATCPGMAAYLRIAVVHCVVRARLPWRLCAEWDTDRPRLTESRGAPVPTTRRTGRVSLRAGCARERPRPARPDSPPPTS